MKKVFVLLLCAMVPILSTCKKQQFKRYEEDPAESKLSPFDRLKGHWKPSDYTFNGTSIVDPIQSIFNNRYHLADAWIVVWEIDKEKGFDFFPPSGGGQGFTFDNEETITFHMAYNDSVSIMWFATPFQPPSSKQSGISTWRVTKLFDNNLNIVLNVDSGEYKLFYEKFN